MSGLQPVSDTSADYTEALIDKFIEELQEIKRNASIARQDKQTYYRLILAELSAFANDARRLAEQTALTGIIVEDAISRKFASELLQVHQATVARWIKENRISEVLPKTHHRIRGQDKTESPGDND